MVRTRLGGSGSKIPCLIRRPFDSGKLSGVVTVMESFFAVGDCCAKELPSPQNAEMTNTNITILHVKEDAHTLYGFVDEGERRLFLHLISISGIGPNTGRMMLSSITPEEIQSAIISGNVSLIQRIKGIGPKSAQRIILELQDKLRKEGPDSLITMPQNKTVKDEALSALVMLGFARNAAEKVLEQEINKNNAELTVEQLIKYALKNL